MEPSWSHAEASHHATDTQNQTEKISGTTANVSSRILIDAWNLCLHFKSNSVIKICQGIPVVKEANIIPHNFTL